MLGFHPYFDIQHNLDVRAVSSRRRQHFIRKEIFLVLISVRGILDPRNTACGQKDRCLKNFQGSYQETNLKPPALWRSTSTNCTASSSPPPPKEN